MANSNSWWMTRIDPHRYKAELVLRIYLDGLQRKRQRLGLMILGRYRFSAPLKNDCRVRSGIEFERRFRIAIGKAILRGAILLVCAVGEAFR